MVAGRRSGLASFDARGLPGSPVPTKGGAAVARVAQRGVLALPMRQRQVAPHLAAAEREIRLPAADQALNSREQRQRCRCSPGGRRGFGSGSAPRCMGLLTCPSSCMSDWRATGATRREGRPCARVWRRRAYNEIRKCSLGTGDGVAARL